MEIHVPFEPHKHGKGTPVCEEARATVCLRSAGLGTTPGNVSLLHSSLSGPALSFRSGSTAWSSGETWVQVPPEAGKRGLLHEETH